jgi:hypothetical protein
MSRIIIFTCMCARRRDVDGIPSNIPILVCVFSHPSFGGKRRGFCHIRGGGLFVHNARVHGNSVRFGYSAQQKERINLQAGAAKEKRIKNE